MHAANLTDAASEFELTVAVDFLDDPHPAIATAQQVTPRAITRAWRARCGVSLGVWGISSSGLARHLSSTRQPVTRA
jgi:hypothetical protein